MVPLHRRDFFRIIGGGLYVFFNIGNPFDISGIEAEQRRSLDPGNNTNTFARESQIDILASKAGIDPIEFRLKNHKDPRMIAVLQALKEKCNWKPEKSPGGRGFGIAFGFDTGTYVAHMAEVNILDRNEPPQGGGEPAII